jgi:hypothetical protein
MFNFSTVKNITNTRVIATPDVRVLAANKVRINDTTCEKLGLNKGKNVMFVKDADNNLAVCSTPQDSPLGRPVNDSGEFVNLSVATFLGKGTEWTLDPMPMFDSTSNNTYYSLLKFGTEPVVSEEVTVPEDTEELHDSYLVSDYRAESEE